MKTKQVSGLLIIIPLCVVVGCAETRQQQGEKLQTWVKRLTPAIVAVCVSDPDNHIPNDRLAAEAMKDDDDLQKAFQDYSIKVKRDHTNVVVLICSRDGKYALLEYASWARGRIERKWYLTRQPQPPVFTIEFPDNATPPLGTKSGASKGQEP